MVARMDYGSKRALADTGSGAKQGITPTPVRVKRLMATNDVPLFWFLDPGFLSFLALCAVGYGVWWLFGKIRDRFK